MPEYPHLPPADEDTEYAPRSHNGEDYLTTGLFPLRSSTHTLADLVRCPVLALDFDASDYLHHQLGEDSPGISEIKELLHESPREEVADLLTEQLQVICAAFSALQIQPSTIVMSGYGFHVYLWTACGGHDIERMRQANRWLISEINTAAGYSLADTSAKDAGTRLLRAPGTYNRKGHSPVKVHLVRSNEEGRTYTPPVPSQSPRAEAGRPFRGIGSANPDTRRNFSEVPIVDAWTHQGYTTLRALADAELGEDGHHVRLQCPFHDGSSTDSAFLSRTDLGQPYLVCTSASDGRTYWDNEWIPPMQQPQVAQVLQVTRQGTFRNNLRNILTVLRLDTRWENKLWYNERTFTEMYEDRPVLDSDIHTAREWLNDHYGFEPGRQNMFDAFLVIAYENRVNPLTDWLDSLEWDGRERVNTWMEESFNCEESDYYRDVARRFLISACARAYSPGCKVDTVLMLVGPQGLGKSTLCRTLAGPGWFDDTDLNLNNKDCFMTLAKAWIYEVAELTSFKKSYAEKVKGFISSQVDLYRKPFHRTVQEYPRHTVIMATSNDNKPLTDPTGSRRYWPVEIKEHVQLAWLQRNREQIWAEAVEAYKAGEKWHQTPALEAIQKQIAEEKFTNEDPYKGVLATWLKRRGDEIFTLSDVCVKALGSLTISTNRVSSLLRECGAAPLKRRRHTGVRISEWVKPGVELPSDREYEDPISARKHISTLNKVIPLDRTSAED